MPDATATYAADLRQRTGELGDGELLALQVNVTRAFQSQGGQYGWSVDEGGAVSQTPLRCKPHMATSLGAQHRGKLLHQVRLVTPADLQSPLLYV